MNVYKRITHNSQKVEKAKCLSTDEYINKMWHIHTVGCYLAIKWTEVLIHVSTWTSLENIMLSERRQSENATYCMRA